MPKAPKVNTIQGTTIEKVHCLTVSAASFSPEGAIAWWKDHEFLLMSSNQDTISAVQILGSDLCLSETLSPDL